MAEWSLDGVRNWIWDTSAVTRPYWTWPMTGVRDDECAILTSLTLRSSQRNRASNSSRIFGPATLASKVSRRSMPHRYVQRTCDLSK